MKNTYAEIELSKADDKTLLQEIKKGNNLAHDEIFIRYLKFLKTEAYYQLRDINLAENVVHDVFLAILEKPRIRRNIQLKHHLFRKVVERCRFIQKDHERLSYEDTTLAEGSHDPTEAYQLKDMRAKLKDAVKHISAASREPLRLRLENKTHQEIATLLELSVDVVKKRISRGQIEVINYLTMCRTYPI